MGILSELLKDLPDKVTQKPEYAASSNAKKKDEEKANTVNLNDSKYKSYNDKYSGTTYKQKTDAYGKMMGDWLTGANPDPDFTEMEYLKAASAEEAPRAVQEYKKASVKDKPLVKEIAQGVAKKERIDQQHAEIRANIGKSADYIPVNISPEKYEEFSNKYQGLSQAELNAAYGSLNAKMLTGEIQPDSEEIAFLKRQVEEGSSQTAKAYRAASPERKKELIDRGKEKAEEQKKYDLYVAPAIRANRNYYFPKDAELSDYVNAARKIRIEITNGRASSSEAKSQLYSIAQQYISKVNAETDPEKRDDEITRMILAITPEDAKERVRADLYQDGNSYFFKYIEDCLRGERLFATATEKITKAEDKYITGETYKNGEKTTAYKNYEDGIINFIAANYNTSDLSLTANKMGNLYEQTGDKRFYEIAKRFEGLSEGVAKANRDKINPEGKIKSFFANGIQQLPQQVYSHEKTAEIMVPLASVAVLTGGLTLGAALKVSYVAGSGISGFELMRGEAMNALTDAGLSYDDAIILANNEGFMNAFIESGDAVIDVLSFGAAEALTKGAVKFFGGKAGKSAASALLKRGMSEKGVKTLFKIASGVGAYIYNANGEGVEEVNQGLVSIVNRHYAEDILSGNRAARGQNILNLAVDAMKNNMMTGNLSPSEEEELTEAYKGGVMGGLFFAGMGAVSGITVGKLSKMAESSVINTETGERIRKENGLSDLLARTEDSKDKKVIRQRNEILKKQAKGEAVSDEAIGKLSNLYDAAEPYQAALLEYREAGRIGLSFEEAKEVTSRFSGVVAEDDAFLAYAKGKAEKTKKSFSADNARAQSSGEDLKGKNKASANEKASGDFSESNSVKKEENKAPKAENNPSQGGKSDSREKFRSVNESDVTGGKNENGEALKELRDTRNKSKTLKQKVKGIFNSDEKEAYVPLLHEKSAGKRNRESLLKSVLPEKKAETEYFYYAGRNGESIESINENYAGSVLSLEEKAKAWAAGKKDRIEYLTYTDFLSKEAESRKNGVIGKQGAGISEDGGTKTLINEFLRNSSPVERNRLNATVKAIDALYKRLGFTLKLTPEVLTKSGKKASGVTIRDKSTVYVGVDTASHKALTGADLLRYAVGHEAIHAIRMNSEEVYGEILDRVKNLGLALSDEAINEKIAEYKENGIEISKTGACEELLAEFIGEVLSKADRKTLHDIIGDRRNIAEVLLDAIDKITNIIRAAAGHIDSELLEQYKKARSIIKDAIKSIDEKEKLSGRSEDMKKSPDNTEDGVKYAVSDKGADEQFQKDYENDVDAVLLRQYPKQKGMLIIGRTPKVYTDIGLNQLPLTIAPNHVYSIAKTYNEAMKDYNGKPPKMNYHGLGETAVKQIMEKISDPIMILTHQEFTQGQREKHESARKVIAVVDFNINGKQVIAPIEIDAEVRVGKETIDSNNVASYFDRGNLNALIQEAVAKEYNGETGFYFIDKKRATAILKRSGQQLPSTLMTDNSDVIIRNISENVNRKISHFTQTLQFKRWFGDWQNDPKQASKVVNPDGTPRIVYHGTNYKFWIFDTGKFNENESSGDYVGEAFFFSKSKETARKYGSNVMAVYLDIKNPLIINSEEDAKNFRNTFLGMYTNGNAELRELIGADYDYFSIMKENPSKIREELQKRGYDGLIDNLYGQYAVFSPNQIKSATENVGTFDGENDDIRYAVSDSESEEGGKKLFPKGRDRARDIDIVSETDKGKTMRFIKTAAESTYISQELAERLSDIAKNGLASYEVSSNAQDVKAAKAWYDGLSDLDEATDYIEKLIQDGEFNSNRDAARAILLEVKLSKAATETANDLERERLFDKAQSLAVEAAAEVTKAGKFIQAFSLIKRLTPEGTLMSITKEIDSINKERGKKVKEDIKRAAEEKEEAYKRAADKRRKAEKKVENAENKVKEAEKGLKSEGNIKKGFLDIEREYSPIRNETDPTKEAEKMAEQFERERLDIEKAKKSEEKVLYEKEILNEENEKLLEELKESAKRLTEAKEAKQAAKKEADRLKNAIDAAKRGERRADIRTAFLGEDIKKLNGEYEEAAKSLAEAKEAKQAAKKEADRLKNAIDAAKRGERGADIRTAFLGEDIKKLNGEYEEAAKSLAEANIELKRARDEYLVVSKRANALKATIRRRKKSTLLLREKKIPEAFLEYEAALSELEAAEKELTIAQQAEKIAKEIANTMKNYKGKNTITLDPELKKAIMDAKDEAALDKARERAIAHLAAQMPRSFFEQLNSWRYLCMLGNLRTHIRNVLGNITMSYMVMKKNIIAGATSDIFLRNSDKEKYNTLRRADKETRKYVNEVYKEEKEALSSGGTPKYGWNVSSEIEGARPLFNPGIFGNILNWGNDRVSGALEWEDSVALRVNFKSAMKQYMVANRLTPKNITEEQKLKAVAHATKEAKEATFRDANKIASLVGELRRKHPKTYFIVNSNVPFTATPTNMLRRAIEYSPLESIQIAKKAADKRNGKITYTAPDVINDVAKVSSGIVTAAVGAALFLLGRLVIGGTSDEDKYKEEKGQQKFSVKLFGHTYTLEWLGPYAVELFLGAQIAKSFTEDEETEDVPLSDKISYIFDAVERFFAPIVEMSLLSSLSDNLEKVVRAGSGKNGLTLTTEVLLAFMENTLTNYLGQTVPTLSGQLARATDSSTRRTTFVEEGAAFSDLRYFLNRNKNKIPVLIKSSPEYVNQFGETAKRKETKGDWAMGALENLILPWYSAEDKFDKETDGEILRLYNTPEAVDFQILSPKAEKTVKVTIGGKEKEKVLNAEEYTEYKKVLGQTGYNAIYELIKSDIYKDMDDAERVRAVGYIWEYAKEKARTTVYPEYKMSSDSFKAEAISGGDKKELAAWAAVFGISEAKADKENPDYTENQARIYNEVYDSSYKALAKELTESDYFKNSDYDVKAEAADMLLSYAKSKAKAAAEPNYELKGDDKKLYCIEENTNLSPSDFLEFKEYEKAADSDGNGSYKQEEINAALYAFGRANGASEKDLAYLWQVETDGVSSKNPYGAYLDSKFYKYSGKEKRTWEKE